MNANSSQNKETVTAFLKMMEERRSVKELEQFYHPDIEQVEFPNAILKATAIRNLDDLKAGAERGSKLMSKETYEIRNLHAFDNSVILEAVWKGTLSIPVGNLAAGDTMVAYFAQFFEFKDGKIYRQRNYDCFEPFV
ncbi:nuclear transport factor 2 family protein [Flavobacterium sp. 3HN19-14]|uniref:nuclear transport factor 2 family protein n=1 Tax=Flavobacterium sp. 3HN19-14 TaxID=3448133 RepID=UPI003EDEA51D